jgi:nicotinate (nicotinamide) nucleotide adenylyltransferase
MNRWRRVGILGGMFDPIHQGHLDTGTAAQRALQLTTLLLAPSNVPPHRPQPVASSYHRFAMVAMAIAGRSGWRASDFELSRAVRSYTSETLRHFHGTGLYPTELYFIIGVDAFLEIATWKDYPALLDHAHFAVVARPGQHLASLPGRMPALASRMRLMEASALAAPEAGAASDAHSSSLAAVPSGASAASDSSEAHRADGAGATDRAPADGDTVIFLIDAPTADVSSTAIRQARHDHRSIEGLVPPAVRQHIDQHGLYEPSSPTAGVGFP